MRKKTLVVASILATLSTSASAEVLVTPENQYKFGSCLVMGEALNGWAKDYIWRISQFSDNGTTQQFCRGATGTAFSSTKSGWQKTPSLLQLVNACIQRGEPTGVNAEMVNKALEMAQCRVN